MIKAFVVVPKSRTVGMAFFALLDIHLNNIVVVAYGLTNQQPAQNSNHRNTIWRKKKKNWVHNLVCLFLIWAYSVLSPSTVKPVSPNTWVQALRRNYSCKNLQWPHCRVVCHVMNRKRSTSTDTNHPCSFVSCLRIMGSNKSELLIFYGWKNEYTRSTPTRACYHNLAEYGRTEKA